MYKLTLQTDYQIIEERLPEGDPIHLKTAYRPENFC